MDGGIEEDELLDDDAEEVDETVCRGVTDVVADALGVTFGIVSS